ncbi:zinc finger protein 185 isoform X1 [Salmo salar]|uniref:Zinc finger protein 185 isoform X1 n=1 Tax=Salmo salar TaxID=8030 RepID=A0ABM3ES21_SALSA|nr:zinc finger protein 185-like isoform X1 [Salmo salar]
MSKEGDRTSVLKTSKVRTKLKGDASWMQRLSEPQSETEEKPWMAEVRVNRLNGAPIDTSQVASPTSKNPPSPTRPAEDGGFFTKTDTKPAATSSTSNGFSGSTSSFTKRPSESYKRIAPHTVRPTSNLPVQAEDQLSPEEKEKREEAAMNVLKTSSVRQRSYVLSTANKYDCTDKPPEISLTTDVPSFVAKRVVITDNDDSVFTETPSVPKEPAAPSVKDVPPVCVKDVSPVSVKDVSPVSVKDVSPVCVKDVSPVCVKDVSPVSVKDVSPVSVKDVPPVCVKDVSPVCVKDVSPVSVKDVSPVSVKDVSPVSVKYVSPVCVKDVSPVSVKDVSPVCVKDVSPVSVKDVSPVCVKDVPSVCVEDIHVCVKDVLLPTPVIVDTPAVIDPYEGMKPGRTKVATELSPESSVLLKVVSPVSPVPYKPVKSDPAPVDTLTALSDTLISFDTGSSSSKVPDPVWTETAEPEDRLHGEPIPQLMVDDLLSLTNGSSDSDSPWDRWSAPTVYKEKEDSSSSFSRTLDSSANQRPKSPDTDSKKCFVYLKEYVDVTDLTKHNTRDNDPDHVTSSSTNHSYSSPSFYTRSTMTSACTYCGEQVGNDAKITIEHLNISCHPACFKCGVCSKPMGDFLFNMFLHKGKVHCESCYANVL